ncbi:MAG TPA: VOC family protein [Thiobacillus sp.]|nr:MAG: VOC family virulence protein [Hydrogenophilales bacterium 28-61-11]OYZ56648.1 MAG: VOC family virulence protein [Hydrogenophilales bacterium 16-61-112]OZA50133.1 MAG: VOC family virulence protein [Hydrogenophilales bacterium 17-61-76]HQT30470.1 VOC family protein [Thiobacillus sp.]HQT68918.1 VOC family protein [Thiobacillus sp.]
MEFEAIDHVVLTVRDIPASVAFYTRVLGMREEVFGEGRRALAFGRCKLNLHQAGREFEPKAAHPAPGAVDLCLLARTSISDIERHLAAHGVAIEQGPIERSGAQGPLLSVYVRDPDGNLIELSNPL